MILQTLLRSTARTGLAPSFDAATKEKEGKGKGEAAFGKGKGKGKGGVVH